MKTSTIILFALATMIIYGWGIIRQSRQTGNLMGLLFSKGQSRVRKYLKKNGAVTIGQVEKLCEGLQAKEPFSANKAVVKDTKDLHDSFSLTWKRLDKWRRKVQNIL